jgi:hypothetical protein
MVYVDDSVSISPSEGNYCVVECTVNRTTVAGPFCLDSVFLTESKQLSGSLLRYLGGRRQI